MQCVTQINVTKRDTFADRCGVLLRIAAIPLPLGGGEVLGVRVHFSFKMHKDVFSGPSEEDSDLSQWEKSVK